MIKKITSVLCIAMLLFTVAMPLLQADPGPNMGALGQDCIFASAHCVFMWILMNSRWSSWTAYW